MEDESRNKLINTLRQLGKISIWLGLSIIIIQGSYYLLFIGRRELDERELTTVEVVFMILGFGLLFLGFLLAYILYKTEGKKNPPVNPDS